MPEYHNIDQKIWLNIVVVCVTTFRDGQRAALRGGGGGHCRAGVLVAPRRPPHDGELVLCICMSGSIGGSLPQRAPSMIDTPLGRPRLVRARAADVSGKPLTSCLLMLIGESEEIRAGDSSMH